VCLGNVLIWIYGLHGVPMCLGAGGVTTMRWHGVGGVILLLLIVAMTVWRAYQRFAWRKDYGRQVG